MNPSDSGASGPPAAEDLVCRQSVNGPVIADRTFLMCHLNPKGLQSSDLRVGIGSALSGKCQQRAFPVNLTPKMPYSWTAHLLVTPAALARQWHKPGMDFVVREMPI